MSALPDRRKQLIRLIHVAKRDRRLDEADYRALLKRETGKESCADMSEVQLDKAYKRLKALGFNVKHSAGRVKQAQPAPAPSRRPHRIRDGQSALISALWIDLWQLGAVRSNDDAAIDAFVRRQTGVERLQWLSPGKANVVIEALKDWLSREGFDVPVVTDEPVPGLAAKRELCRAIHRKLSLMGRAIEAYDDEMERCHQLSADEAHWLADRLAAALRRELQAERGE